MNPPDSSAEWLEADGLGGFASGTVSGIRTRRYHALLLTATTPPARRMVLANGFGAWVETPHGTFAISSQRYGPDVIHPDGASRIESFEYDPWPRWRYKIEDLVIEHELFVPKGESAIFMSWKLVDPKRQSTGALQDAGATGNESNDACVLECGGAPPLSNAIKLRVRLFLSCRDFHSTHDETSAFHLETDQNYQ